MMINIRKIVSEKLDEFKQKQTIKKANELKQLKADRIKFEGRANIDKLHREEKEKIAKAKKEMFNNSLTGKAINHAKKHMKEAKKKNKGLFANSSPNPALDFSNINNPYNYETKNPFIPKKKKR